MLRFCFPELAPASASTTRSLVSGKVREPRTHASSLSFYNRIYWEERKEKHGLQFPWGRRRQSRTLQTTYRRHQQQTNNTSTDLKFYNTKSEFTLDNIHTSRNTPITVNTFRSNDMCLLNRRFAWWRHFTTETRMLCQIFCYSDFFSPGEQRDNCLKLPDNRSNLRNGPDKNDSSNGNRHVGIQFVCKKGITFLLSVLTFDWLKQQKLTKLHKSSIIFILTFQPSSIFHLVSV